MELEPKEGYYLSMGRKSGAEDHIVIYVGEANLGFIEARSFKSKDKPLVFRAQRIPYNQNGGLMALKDSLGQLLTDGAKNGSFRAGDVHVIFAPAHFEVTIVEASREENQPFKITQELISDLLKGEDCKDAERLVTHCTLHGYPTASPFGKQASSVQAKIWSLLIDTGKRETITRAIKEHLHREISAFHSESLVLYRAVSCLNLPHDSYVIALTSPLSAHVLLIRDGGIVAAEKDTTLSKAYCALKERESLPITSILYRAEALSLPSKDVPPFDARELRASDFRTMVDQHEDIAIDSDLLLSATLCATL